MQFVLADVPFPVLIWPRPLIVDGEACYAILDRARSRILISHEVSPADRQDKLLHELRHLWTDTYGLPADPESDARSAEEFHRWFRPQFDSQGGANALALLQPEADARPRNGQGASFSEYIRCMCEAPIAPGSIVNGKPTWSDHVNSYIRERSMHCENCGRVCVWFELSTADGHLNNSPVLTPPPRELLGDEKFAWLCEHGETARVCV